MNTTYTLVTKLARAFLALFMVAVPLLFSTATIEGFEDLKAAALILTALAFAALGLVAMMYAKVRPLALLRQPLVLGVLLFALSAIVSAVFSISPRTSWRGAIESRSGLMTILGYVVLFFAARRLGGGRRLLAGVVLAAAVASTYALVQAARHDPVDWDGTQFFGAHLRPFGTMGHANLLGAYLAMSLPLVAYFGLRSMQRRRWVLLPVLAVIAGAMAVALILTLSRAAWLAAGCASVVLLTGWWFGRARRAVAVGFVVLLIAGSVGALVYERQWMPETVQTALGERRRHLDDVAGRRDIWQAGWQIYRDHPVTGSGLDTFRLAFGAKRTAAFWDKEGEGTPTKAHNEALHILATQGTLGGVALLALLVGLSWTVGRAWHSAQDRGLVAVLAASVVAFGVTNLFGFTVIATGSLCVVCAGLLSRMGEPAGPEEDVVIPSGGWRVWATPGIVFTTMIVAYLLVIEPMMANLSCRRGDLVLADAPGQAASCYQHATEFDPGCDAYYVRLADAAHREAVRTGATNEVQRTRTALERAVALVPADAYHHANLARFLGELCRTDPSVRETALAEWRQATALDPNNPYILAEAGRTALVVGEFTLAKEYAEHGTELYPTWAIFHAQLGAAALGQGDWPDAVQGLEQAVNADWHNDTEALSRSLAMLATAQFRLNNFAKAQELAGKASVWLPQWPTPHLMRAQALNALGQRNEAIREMMTARALQGQPVAPVTSANPR